MMEVSEVEGSVPPSSPKERVMAVLKENLLLVLTVFSVAFGLFFGFILRLADPSDDWILVIGFPGEILMRVLKMLVLPLIVASLIYISGLSTLDAKASGKLGIRAVLYYVTTTVIAVCIGMFLVLIIQPGRNSENVEGELKPSQLTSLDTILDLIRNMFPSNIMQACFQQTHTYYETVDKGGEMVDVRKTGSKAGTNVLGILMYCLVFGILLGRMGRAGQVMIDFFAILCEITLKMIDFAIWYSPIGIASLICAKILEMKDPGHTFAKLALYSVTVLLGLVMHLGVLMGMYIAMTKKNPLKFFVGMLQAWFTALATASSAATLPVTFKCVEENNGVDKRISRFLLPIGATVNMDGTALYEAVACVFVGQLNNIRMTFGKVLTICLTSTLASIGAASIPSAGITTLVLVLTAADFPVDDISLLLSVDWFIDRCRTSLNVLGDSYGAAIIEHYSQKELEEATRREMEARMEAGSLYSLGEKIEAIEETTT